MTIKIFAILLLLLITGCTTTSTITYCKGAPNSVIEIDD
jgi:hypothetical protein